MGAAHGQAASGQAITTGAPLEPLIAALRDEEYNVRREAAGALERICTPEALAALEGWEP